MSIKSIATTIAARLREPSTHAGLAAVALLCGVPPGVPETVIQAVTGICAALAVLLPEKAPGA